MSQNSSEKQQNTSRLLIFVLLLLVAGLGTWVFLLKTENQPEQVGLADTTSSTPAPLEQPETEEADTLAVSGESQQEDTGQPVSKAKPTRKKESAKKDTAAVTAPDPCEGVVIKAKILTNSSPWDAEAGTIQIDNRTVSGGTAPYSFSIDTASGFNMFTLIHKVKPGTYSVFIKDVKGCISEVKNVTVEKDPCTSKYGNSFSPSADGMWSLPLSPGIKAEVSVISSKGKPVYSKSGVSGKFSWDGRNASGEPAEAGVYRVVVEYQGLKMCTVALTVMK